MCSCQLCNACCSDAEDYLEVLRVNAVGPLLVTKHFLPLLRKSSVRPKIVNISSSMGSLTKNRENRKVPMVSNSWLLEDFLMNQASPLLSTGRARIPAVAAVPFSQLAHLCSLTHAASCSTRWASPIRAASPV